MGVCHPSEPFGAWDCDVHVPVQKALFSPQLVQCVRIITVGRNTLAAFGRSRCFMSTACSLAMPHGDAGVTRISLRRSAWQLCRSDEVEEFLLCHPSPQYQFSPAISEWCPGCK